MTVVQKVVQYFVQITAKLAMLAIQTSYCTALHLLSNLNATDLVCRCTSRASSAAAAARAFRVASPTSDSSHASGN